ncbi:MAG TPA: pyridoxal phosphate-dependent aminotransferase [Thermohalobaculum sp.]|nr:pyridoxal phosphate-dependent aminotransferase [Thermohalobaculum sp.]
MQVSERIRAIVPGGKDGWELLYRAWEMQRAGEPVVMLTIGDHDIKTDPAILRAMQDSMARGNLGYAALAGAPELRAAIAGRVTAGSAVPAGPENVVVTPGGQAALFSAMMAALDPGQGCVILDPYYATYPSTVRAAGGRPLVVPTRADDGFEVDAGAIARALGPDTRAILLNTPNNPTGAVYGRDRLEAVARLAVERDLWVISDEVYHTQLDDRAHLSPRDLDGMAERTLVVNSLSKSHAMTGSRLGWVVAPAAAARRIADLAVTTTYGVPGFIQDAALFALTDGQGARAEAEIAARYARRRALALDALGGAAGIGVLPPSGGMYLMLDIRATGLGGEDFATRLLDEERIAVMPGESFGTAAAGHLRIALTVPDDALRDALGRIARFAARLLAETV